MGESVLTEDDLTVFKKSTTKYLDRKGKDRLGNRSDD